MSALELAASIKSGERRAIDVVEETLAAIDQARALGAFAHLCPDLARDQARRIDATDKAELGPLAGVPVPIKDLTNVQGQPCEFGSALMVGHVSSLTDGIVSKLHDAGTITVGKTTAPEFGFPAYSETSIGLPARTPYDTRRSAGGSSGGAAAAVAAGLVPAAHASDGGGSIRIPSACCGTVGLKPSRGVVSPGPYGQPGPGLVTDGVITTTVGDAAAFLDVIAGSGPADTFSRPHDAWRAGETYLSALNKNVGQLRIGILTEPLNVDHVDLHPHALCALQTTAHALESMGHVLDVVSRPITTRQWRSFMPLWTGAAAAMDLSVHQEEMLRPLSRWLREEGKKLSAADYARALSSVQSLGGLISRALTGYDLLLTPTLSGPPPFPSEIVLDDPAADFEAQCRLTPWGSVWNMTGWPSISLPVYRGEVDGVELPFGVMINGLAAGQDSLILSVARDLEEALPWPRVTPIRELRDTPPSVPGRE